MLLHLSPLFKDSLVAPNAAALGDYGICLMPSRGVMLRHPVSQDGVRCLERRQGPLEH